MSNEVSADDRIVTVHSIKRLFAALAEKTSCREVNSGKGELVSVLFAASGARNALHLSSQLTQQLNAYNDIPDVTVTARLTETEGGGQRFQCHMVRRRNSKTVPDSRVVVPCGHMHA
jgi:hypothetical protein